MRLWTWTLAFGFFVVCGSGTEPEGKAVVWTGWFSDFKCASARAGSGTFTPTNPDCARRCIEQGAAPAFISEQSNAVYAVSGYSSLLDHLGYHVEVRGRVDEARRTIAIESVKRLEYSGAACARPKKPAGKQ
jgi:hypothetical protein